MTYTNCIAILPNGKTMRTCTTKGVHSPDEALRRLENDLRAWVENESTANEVVATLKAEGRLRAER